MVPAPLPSLPGHPIRAGSDPGEWLAVEYDRDDPLPGACRSPGGAHLRQRRDAVSPPALGPRRRGLPLRGYAASRRHPPLFGATGGGGSAGAAARWQHGAGAGAGPPALVIGGSSISVVIPPHSTPSDTKNGIVG